MLNRINDNLNEEKILRKLEYTRAKMEAENMYLAVKGKEIGSISKNA